MEKIAEYFVFHTLASITGGVVMEEIKVEEINEMLKNMLTLGQYVELLQLMIKECEIFMDNKENIGSQKEGRVTMTRQEGEFCNKRCPKCGATLLKNERGDEWCSSPGCEYLLKELKQKVPVVFDDIGGVV